MKTLGHFKYLKRIAKDVYKIWAVPIKSWCMMTSKIWPH